MTLQEKTHNTYRCALQFINLKLFCHAGKKKAGEKNTISSSYHRYSKDHVLLGVHLVLEKSATRQN